MTLESPCLRAAVKPDAEDGLAQGELGFWKVRVLPEHDSTFDPKALMLFKEPFDAQHISFLPLVQRKVQGVASLERVVLGREAAGSPDLLCITFQGSPALLRRQGHRKAGGVMVERMRQADVPELRSLTHDNFATVDMTQEQVLATDVLFAEPDMHLPQGPRWWRVLWRRITLHNTPSLESTTPLKFEPKLNEIVLAEKISSDCARLIVHPTGNYYMRAYSRGMDPPELLQPLEGRDGARTVLRSWKAIQTTWQKLSSWSVEDTTMGSISERIKEIVGSRLEPNLGKLQTQRLMRGESMYHRTFELTFKKPYIMHIDLPDIGMGIPAIVGKARAAAAREVFADPVWGLSPRQHSEGPGWRLEESAGEELSRTGLLNRRKVEQLAKCIAKKDCLLPTGWFDEYREIYRWLVPELMSAPEGSHVWRAVASKGYGGIHQRKLPDWARWKFEPKSWACRRLVTCHGDLHPGNILVTDEGNIKLVDHEVSCVTWAIEDLADIQQIFDTNPYPPQTAVNFARAYLEQVCHLAARQSPAQQDIEDFVSDLRDYTITETRYRT